MRAVPPRQPKYLCCRRNGRELLDAVTVASVVEPSGPPRFAASAVKSNLKRYAIAPAIKPEEGQYDGIVELYHESTDAVRDATTEKLDQAIREDGRRFLKNVTKFVAAERIRVDGT